MDIATLRAAVGAAQNPAPHLVRDVPGLGDVFVRINTARQAAEARRVIAAKAAADEASGLAVGRSLATLLCDETGALAFDPESDADAVMLANLSERAIHRLMTEATRANFPELEKDAAEGNG